MIDTGSDVTKASTQSYLERNRIDLRKRLQVVHASGQFTKLTKAAFGQLIAIHDTTTDMHKIMPLPTVVIQAPKQAS